MTIQGRALKRNKPLQRKTGLRARSKKRAKVMREERVPFVARLLEERPVCEIQWDENCTGRATEVDEIVGRGRGGDFLDEDNCQTGCHYCHHMKTTHPAEARARGLERHSWDKRSEVQS